MRIVLNLLSVAMGLPNDVDLPKLSYQAALRFCSITKKPLTLSFIFVDVSIITMLIPVRIESFSSF